MDMHILGLHPMNSRFDAIEELRDTEKRYRGKMPAYLNGHNIVFLNHMTCLKALFHINSAFSLSFTAYKKVLRDSYVYFDGIMLPLAEMSYCVVAYIYNHIFWAQDSSLDEIKVGDVERFTFEGI